MPPLPTTAQLMHRELPAGRLARSSCCWGTGGKRITTFCTTAMWGAGGIPLRAQPGPGGRQPAFLLSPLLIARSGEVGQRQKSMVLWDFPGGPLVKILCSLFRALGSIPEIPYAATHGQRVNTDLKHSF